MICRIYTVFLVIGLATPYGYSQNIFREGTLIKNGGDSVTGFIKLKGKRFAPTKILFKEDKKSTIQDLDFNTVNSIVLTKFRYYKTITTTDSIQLAQLLIRGHASLYSWNNQFYLEVDTTIYPLEIEETRVAKVNTENYIHRKKTYIGILKSKFKDCPQLQSDIDRARLTETSLSELVERYNDCTGTSSYVFKKEIPLYKFSISPIVGVTYTNLDVGYAPQFTFIYGFYDLMKFNQVTFTPGVNINISSPRIDERVSISIEARYLKNSFNDRVIYPQSTFDDNEISLRYSYLYLPITVQNDFPIGINESLYIKLGLLYTFNLSKEFAHVKRISSAPNSNPIVVENQYEFYSPQSGFVVGAGYKMKLTNRLSSFSEFRFENPGPLTNSGIVSFDPTCFQ